MIQNNPQKISFIKKLFILPVRFYQRCMSPLLPNVCRHTPSCSQYMIEAIEIHGVIKGIYLGTKRLFRCHPWGTSGHDPVPPKKEPKNPDNNI